MELHTLVPELSVTAQIAASDLAALHAAGYRSIVCNRPDGEGADQPDYGEIEQAALALGIAARKQASVVAHNVLVGLGQLAGDARYDGYGSCPLTVERGKIVLAEFLYAGKLAPSLPKWLIDGTRPSRAAWYLNERLLPPLYREGMLKGREWLARPEMVG